MKIIAAKKILEANDRIAAENRRRLSRAGVLCVNLVGSPGAGKTTLLEALLAELEDRARPAVIEGDIAGSIDAERIERLGGPRGDQVRPDGSHQLRSGPGHRRHEAARAGGRGVSGGGAQGTGDCGAGGVVRQPGIGKELSRGPTCATGGRGLRPGA